MSTVAKHTARKCATFFTIASPQVMSATLSLSQGERGLKWLWGQRQSLTRDKGRRT